MDVTMPDGTVIQGVPEGTTKAMLQQKYAAHMGKAESMVGSLMNGIANAGTFNLMAPIAAALGATTREGETSQAPDWVSRYDENLAKYRTQDEATRSAHPAAAISGEVVGSLLNPAMRALPIAKTIPGVIGQGAALGAGYGAGTAVTDQSSLTQAGLDIAKGAAIGGAIPAAIPAANAVVRGAGKAAASVLGGITTGAGANSVKQAFRSGLEGGDQSAAFLGSMRGDTPWAQVVDDAKGALANMRAQRNAAYRSGMADLSKDATVLDFKPVDDALAKTASVKSFKGQDLSPKTADVRKEITDTIDEWRQLPPEEYHTPEGFDALKQKLGDIRDSLPFNTPQRVIADNAYNAVRKSIADQAPAYDKIMADYSKASDQVAEIQKELSLGPKGNPNTALRKLQSVMRDNVNTSFGDRAKYSDLLKENGAGTLNSALAGQSLSSALPRGLAKYGDTAAALLALTTSPGSLAALPLASPRVVGEVAHGLGRGIGSLPKIGGLTRAGVSRAVVAPGAATIIPAFLPRLPQ